MTATVAIQAYSGASGTPTLTDVTSGNTRFNTSDTYAASGTSTPIPIPSVGTNYSYWIAYGLDATVTPAGTIDNVRFYADGSNDSPAGVSWKAQTATSYVQATGTPGETGDALDTTNYPTLATSTSDVFDFTSSAPLTVTGSITNPSTGAFGDWVVIQVEVASTTATSGAVTSETWSWVFDET